MEILFGILVLALIILGLWNRKKEKKEWVKEEHYEESGAWLDKRSGERGTYGSLDEEMESNRLYIAKQAKISELTMAVQAYIFAQSADLQNLSDKKIKEHLTFCKSESAGFFKQIENFIIGRPVSISGNPVSSGTLQTGLKKEILRFTYERFPKLLDLEIEQIKKIDLLAALFSERILEKLDGIKT